MAVSACVVWRGTQFDVNRPHETCCRRLEGKDGANETVKCGNMEVCTGSLMAGCRAGQGRGGPVSQPARAFRSASLDPSQQAAVWGDVASLWQQQHALAVGGTSRPRRSPMARRH
eukprot:COSAG01_NODE_1090_length_11748_cov_58.142244_8_plen_115_part_00